MLRIGSFFNSVLGLFSVPKTNGKIDTLLLPKLDPTSFTEARHLPKLNRLLQEEKLKESFTATLPWEDFESKEQAFLIRMQESISTMTNLDLHGLVSSQEQEEDPFIRRLGAAELVNRKDATAWLTFLFCIILEKDDYVVRKICAIGLGKLGRRDSLKVLESIKEDDCIYSYAQEAIRKIRAYETCIKVM